MTQQPYAVCYQLVYIRWLANKICFADQRPHAVDDRAGTCAVSHHAVCSGSGTRHIHGLSAKPAPARRRVSHQGCERLIEFMGNQCGHLCHAHGPWKARLFFVRLQHALLRSLLLFDIDVHAVPLRNCAGGIFLRNAAHQKPSIGSCRAADAHLRLKHLSRTACRIPALAKEPDVFGVKNVKELFSAQLLSTSARILDEIAIAMLDATRLVCRPYLLRDSLCQTPQIALAFKNLPIGALRFGCALLRATLTTVIAMAHTI